MRYPAAMAALLTAAAAISAGCGEGVRQTVLGAEGEHLVLAMDELTTPGQAVLLRTQVRGGDFLQGRPGLAVRILRDGRLFKVAETGDDGLASVTFTPHKPGDCAFAVHLVPAGFRGKTPPPAGLLVACRKPDEPIAVVDLDKTVVASGFEAVLLGSPEPMARSRDILARLARTRTIVYMTHRPELLGPKSKAWLIDHDYPPGPLLLSDTEGFLGGSGSYKTSRLAAMRKTFPRVRLGIGDKLSDARAYLDNDMKAVLILDIPPAGVKDRAGKLRALADELSQFADDEEIQVVTGWDEVEKALFDGQAYPPSSMRRRLMEMAAGNN